MHTLGRCLAALLLLATAAVASAADAPKGAAPAMTPPKPDPMLETAFKGMAGSWKCTGKMTMPDGKVADTKSAMNIGTDLDGFVYTGEWTMEPAGGMPAMKMRMLWSHDAVSKKLMEVGFDNMGGNFHGTSDGMKGNVIVWNDEGTMMGKPAKMRSTITRKSDKEITVVGEMESGGKWTKMGEDVCKK